MTRNRVTPIGVALAIGVLIGISVLSTAKPKPPSPPPQNAEAAQRILNEIGAVPAFRSEVASVELTIGDPSIPVAPGGQVVVVRNIGQKPIAYFIARTALEIDSMMSGNFMVAQNNGGRLRSFGPLRPQEECAYRVSQSSLFIVTAVAYTDGKSEGLPLDAKYAGAFLKSWKGALAPYERVFAENDSSDVATVKRALKAEAEQQLGPDPNYIGSRYGRGKWELDDWVKSIIELYPDDPARAVSQIREMVNAAKEIR